MTSKSNDNGGGPSLIGLSVPDFLTVKNSPIYSGIIELTYNHTPLPITSGGTGLTSVGSVGQVLGVVSTTPTPQLGWISSVGVGTVTSVSLSLPPFLQSSESTITSAGTFDISYSSTPLPISSGGTGFTSVGPAGTLFASNGSTYEWIDPPATGVTSVSLSLPPFLKSSSQSITSAGSFDISYSATPLPISSGGTGFTSVGPAGKILASDGEKYLWADQTSGTVTSVSLSLPSFLKSSVSTITSDGLFDISYSSTPLPISSGGTGITFIGSKNQILVSDGTNYAWQDPNPASVTSVGLTTLEAPFLTVSNSPITTSGTFSLSYTPNVALPVSSGGTGVSVVGLKDQILISDGEKLIWDFPKQIPYLESLTAKAPLQCTSGPNPQVSIGSSTGSNSIVLSDSPTITTPTLISPSITNATASSINLNSVVLSSVTNSNYNLILPSSIGRTGQVLTSQGVNKPLIWTSPSPIGSDSLLVQDATITSLKPIIQKNGNNNITDDTLLSVSTLFQFQTVSSTNASVSITTPSALDLLTYLADSSTGTTFTGTLLNMTSTEVEWMAGENVTIFDSRPQKSIQVQLYQILVVDSQTVYLLLK